MESSGYQVGDRRPLASRQARWAVRLAAWLAGLGTSANAISMAGMFFGCAAGALLGATSWVTPLPARICFLAAAAAVQLRLACNLLDGMVAVNRGTASRVGELYNELPDRISDSATLIGAGYAIGGLPVLGFIAACLALLTAYVRALGKVAGGGHEFCGPMAKQQRMFVITIIALFCAIAPAGWQPRIGGLGIRGGPGLMAAALLLIIIGSTVTVVRRLRRIVRTLEQPRI